MALQRLAVALASVVAAAGVASATAADAAPKVVPPGVYGRVDVGKFPEPALVARTATTADPNARRGSAPEVFLWVPAAHRFDWRTYCGRYAACAARVYFVTDEWYYHHGPGRGLPDPEDAHRDHGH